MDNNFNNEENSILSYKQKQTLVETCFRLSISYLVLWLIILVVFFISIGLFVNSNNENDFSLNLALSVPIDTIVGFSLIILGIFLVIKTLSLKRQYLNYVKKGLFVWFWVGLYLFGIPSFVGSILLILDCKKIKKLNSEKLESINYDEYINNVINSHNLKLVKTCKRLSILYTVMFSILIVFLIVFLSVMGFCLNQGYEWASVAQQSWHSWYWQDYYSHFILNTLNNVFFSTLIICFILWFILFILSIVLTAKTISLYKFYFHYAKFLFIWFLVGWLFLWFITSIIGSIITIIKCNKIKKQYPDELQLTNKENKKLSISFTVLGSALSIIGAGLIGGTYGSYNNFQLLACMQSVIEDNYAVWPFGYSLNDNNLSYFSNLVNNYSLGSYDSSGNTINGLKNFFNFYNNILQWLTNSDNNGIIDYLSTVNNSSSTSDDSNLVNQTINDLTNFKNNISNGFPSASTIENVLTNVSYSKDDYLAQQLTNALNEYNGTSGLLSTISTIDSDLTKLINDKVIDLSDTSNMNSTTKQYFKNYINLLGTDSATLIGVNPSRFVAMFDTNQAISAFGNSDAIGLNSLSLYLSNLDCSQQTFFETIFTLYKYVTNSLSDSYMGFSIYQISPDEWNENIANLSDFQKANLNSILQTQKNAFYKLYPTWNGDWEKTAINANLSIGPDDNEAERIYYLQDSIYHLNCNYDADQSGVIAGSVLISIGLVSLVVAATSLGIIRKKEKKQAKQFVDVEQ